MCSMTEQKATTLAEPQRKTLGYVRVSTHKQAISGLPFEARKRKAALYAPATAPPRGEQSSYQIARKFGFRRPEDQDNKT